MIDTDIAADTTPEAGTVEVEVLEIVRHGENVFELITDRRGIAFSPGDNVAVFNADGTESRPYSIASGVDDKVLRLVVSRLPDGVVSQYIAALKPGDTLTVSEPFGWFRPGPNPMEDGPFIFIATGTGITPFLSYVRSFPERPPLKVFYGVRRGDDAVGVDVLEAAAELHLAVSRESAAGRHHGRVTDLLNHVPVQSDLHVYLCGLDAMIDEVSDRLEGQGLDFTHIHREVFFYAPY